MPVEHQGKGIIKGVFQISLQQYVNMGARKITVHSGLEGGGYAWAKAGFVAVDKNEVEVILEAARRILQPDELARVERIYNKYYSDFPNGNAFPIVLWARYEPMKQVLSGSDWHGEVDLKDQEQFSSFNDYVFRK